MHLQTDDDPKNFELSLFLGRSQVCFEDTMCFFSLCRVAQFFCCLFNVCIAMMEVGLLDLLFFGDFVVSSLQFSLK